jgi:hypothetical protein
MSTEHKKALACRIPEEFFKKGNPLLLYEICAPNFVLNHSEYMKTKKEGR